MPKLLNLISMKKKTLNKADILILLLYVKKKTIKKGIESEFAQI